MTRLMTALALGSALVAFTARGAYAQQPPAAPAAQPAPAPVPQPPPIREGALLRVQVIISRYQGDKKISSQPYMLSVTANGPRATLRMGLQVPVPAFPVPASDNKNQSMPVNYRNVGTNIDCTARSLDDGRFRLELTVDDSSLAADEANPPFAKGIPQFRSFLISGETAVLRDGQTSQLTSATEKVTGEVAKVDVTLNVVK